MREKPEIILTFGNVALRKYWYCPVISSTDSKLRNFNPSRCLIPTSIYFKFKKTPKTDYLPLSTKMRTASGEGFSVLFIAVHPTSRTASGTLNMLNRLLLNGTFWSHTNFVGIMMWGDNPHWDVSNCCHVVPSPFVKRTSSSHCSVAPPSSPIKCSATGP